VRVFGSVARGTADKQSDVDLLIDFVGRPPDDFDYYGILLELQEAIQDLLGCAVHVVHLENASSPRAHGILRDAVAL
jgi:predicted nucleotidyltransferase